MRSQFSISKSKGASAPVVVLPRPGNAYLCRDEMMVFEEQLNLIALPKLPGRPNGWWWDYALSVICKRALAHWVSPAPAFSHPPRSISPSFIGLSTAKLYAE